jgi:hypothetical protein
MSVQNSKETCGVSVSSRTEFAGHVTDTSGTRKWEVPGWESSFILRLSRNQAVLLKRRQFDDVNTHCCHSVARYRRVYQTA